MTLLGKRTIHEARDFATLIEFRIKALFRLISKKNNDPLAFQPGHPGVPPALIKRFNVWVERWNTVSGEVLSRITVISAINPLVSADVQPVEEEYQKLNSVVMTIVNGDNLAGLSTDIQRAAGEDINETDRPKGLFETDVDFAALRKLDATIAAGEKASKEAKGAVKTGITIPWWGWGIGAVIVGGVGYSVVKTGQGVAEKARRDTEYIHENMTSKVLPGYKG